jgi:hypothetical protein
VRPAVVVLAAAALAGGLAACSSGGTGATASYCDLVKVAAAGTDPLADQSIFNDPAHLQAAMKARVQQYTDLAAKAPAEIAADAGTVRDDVIKVNNALAKHGYQSIAANSDPDLQAALNDQTLTAAAQRLMQFDADKCT